MTQRRRIRRALVSVYDKTGLVELARALDQAGVQIVSTGSTAKTIMEHGIAVTPVVDVTGFPECLNGRVKTLHPHIHAGLLADLSLTDHVDQLHDLGIEPFELVVVNLYPFTDSVATGAEAGECVEQIDIGGPAMVRASAKNFAHVAVVVSPTMYPQIIAALNDGGFSLPQRQQLAADAFAHTATYDVAIATWMMREQSPSPWVGSTYVLSAGLRYGENPHQQAGVYRTSGGAGGLAGAEQLQGKEMSYNNYVDADAALRAATDHAQAAVAIIKHANPCGIAVGDNICAAYSKAFDTDPVSAFGGVVAANRIVTAAMAEAMAPVFTEVVIAPGYEAQALEVLAAKPNLRVLRTISSVERETEWRAISGGLLVQQLDTIAAAGDPAGTWTLACGEPADGQTLADLEFAWRSVRAVKSNAILLAKDGAAVGVGMGQVNRVDSARLAVARAGEDRVRGCVAASDAFFPFPDGLEVLLQAGVRAIVQPGGSVRDEEVIAAARAAGATMYLTGGRHFFH